MRQVLWEIPWIGLRLYGFGVMLVVAVFAAEQVAARAALRSGGKREDIYDLSLWILAFGLLGARLFYMVQKRDLYDRPLLEFFEIWKGGLVIYGAMTGALVGFWIFTRRRGLKKLWLLDVLAPSLALGLGIGRLGCLLNGCCYGDYCEHAWAIRFPPGSPAYQRQVVEGQRSRLGFDLDLESGRVLFVEPDSDAQRAGLRPGDRITRLDGRTTGGATEREQALLAAGLGEPERSRVAKDPILAAAANRPFELEVDRAGELRHFVFRPPRSLPVHPTQVYSSIKGLVLFLILSWLQRIRHRDGEVIAWGLILYSPSRFLIESLRGDEPAFFASLTISQTISLPVFVVGAVLLLYARRSPIEVARTPVA